MKPAPRSPATDPPVAAKLELALGCDDVRRLPLSRPRFSFSLCVLVEADSSWCLLIGDGLVSVAVGEKLASTLQQVT